MTMNDTGHGGWYIDTGATYHVHRYACILNIVLLKSKFSSFVLVGDGSSILIANVGHTTIPNPNPYHTLHLKNILTLLKLLKISFPFVGLLLITLFLLNLTHLVSL